MKKIIEIGESTIIFWLPILALYIAELLGRIIIPEIIMNCIVGFGVLCLVILLVIDITSWRSKR